jgi:hypothetical protein
MSDITPEAEMPEILIASTGMLHSQFCVRDTATDEQVVQVANATFPTGISSQWEFDGEHPGTEPCNRYPNRRHVVVTC